MNIIKVFIGCNFIGEFNNCQFFEHDVAENRSMHLRQCPPEDQCCFTLREHMAVEFWGHQGML